MNLDDLPEYRSVMLLQGPMGGYFELFGAWLRARGTQTLKVNFNAGDDADYQASGVVRIRESLTLWPDRFVALARAHRTDAIFLFGDCRPVHKAAIKRAQDLGLDVWVFEEGYQRPGYITLERQGVNANSLFRGRLPADADPEAKPPPRSNLLFAGRRDYFFGILASLRYALAYARGRSIYPLAQHHRDLGADEMLRWWKGWALKPWHKLTEWPLRRRIIDHLPAAPRLAPHITPCYLLVLQTVQDSQLQVHSEWRSVDDFIDVVLRSFAKSAPERARLVIKHHPRDRGHYNYLGWIQAQTKALGISARVSYVHDLPLADVIKRFTGIVTINSTVGLQALYNRVPVLLMGRAIYQHFAQRDALERFWKHPKPVAFEDFMAWRQALLAATQVRGSFYDHEQCCPEFLRIARQQLARERIHALAPHLDAKPALNP